jgi:putative restriction endonuclease
VHGTIAVTDFGWYQHLAARSVSEANFWTPSDRRPFNAPQFSPFFFKLKVPHNAIGGFGYFARWSSLPDWLAWETFGEANGVASLADMRERIGAIRQRIGYVPSGTLTNIGCILIVEPLFFHPGMWVPQPEDWPARTVSSKGYDLTLGEGRRVWEACLERASMVRSLEREIRLIAEPTARYGAARLIAPRLGQGTFRIAVTEAYGRRCAVTGEHSLPVLDAAHIRSYGEEGPHEVRNGILMRADLHRLFDKGYISVSFDYRVLISDRLREDYQNGRSYYPMRDHELHVPSSERDRPDPEFIRWHNERVFLG